MRENAPTILVTDLRRSNRKTHNDLRLPIEIYTLYLIQKDEDKPKSAEITIPDKSKRWTPDLRDIRGILIQGACNFFSLELGRGRCEKPPISPFIVGKTPA